MDDTLTASQPPPRVYSTFLRRIQAAFIDGLVLIFVYMGILALLASTDLPGWLRFFIMLLPIALFEAIQVSLFGATIGYRVCRQRVVRERDGKRLGPAEAIVRSWIKLLLGWLSLLLMFGTKKHQAMHDLAAGSIVLATRPDEGITEREMHVRFSGADAPRQFVFPSVWRRSVAAILWCIDATIAAILIGILAVPESCIVTEVCSADAEAILGVLAVGLLLAICVILAAAMTSHLPGAMRIPSDGKRVETCSLLLRSFIGFLYVMTLAAVGIILIVLAVELIPDDPGIGWTQDTVIAGILSAWILAVPVFFLVAIDHRLPGCRYRLSTDGVE